MDIKMLTMQLTNAETEASLISVLAKFGLWDDLSHWRPIGDNDNNFSTIGNQQSKPDAALVEKIINSVDAILMKECLVRGIDMTSSSAPQTMAEAMSAFLRVRDGQLSNIDTKTRNEMSNSIILAATGKRRGEMNITIVDQGEGQTPNCMPNTLLSISRNNKLKVPFVQGKFNMGGTGVIPFCGKHKLQLIISRRCQEIPNTENDSTFSYWSVTVIRREEPREGRKSSMYTYLTDGEGEMLKFYSSSLPIIPVPQIDIKESMMYGTYIKLFNYSIPSYKSNILLDLNYRLAMLMPNLAHPVRLRECRVYEAHTYETTLSGLETRLADDRQNNVEDGFPDSNAFTVEGQLFRCSIYLFKKGKSKNYREKDGVLFHINGQTHGTITDTFFNKANLPYLSDSLLVLVDCSDISISHREDMFMNSRDRLRDGQFSKDVTSRIQEILREHDGLKLLQNIRRQEAIQERLSEDKPLQDVLQKILRNSPVLSRIMLTGQRLSNPFGAGTNVGEDKEYIGRKHPTYFRIKGKLTDGQLMKVEPISNKSIRVQFETDVVNDYFARPVEAGKLLLRLNGQNREDLVHRLSLFNGTATLTVTLPKNLSIGDTLGFDTQIIDEYIVPTFDNKFVVILEDAAEPTKGKSGSRTPPRDETKSGKREIPNSAAMPNIQEKYRADWGSLDMDSRSALVLFKTEENSDYFINMDNDYLLSELKQIRDESKMSLVRARYKYSMALIGMSIESYYKSKKHSFDVPDPQHEVKRISTIIAPVLIPMLDAMAELTLDDV